MESNGIQYFPIDIDIFDDPKVVPAICKYGEDAERVILRLLCSLYREGYCIEYNDALKFMLSMKTRKDPDYIDKVILALVQYGFFDQDLFHQKNILTSAGIQKRWLQATRKRTRKNFDFKFWLLDSTTEKEEKVIENEDQAEALQKQAEVLDKQAEAFRPSSGENRQSKVKESKVKESIEDKKLSIEKRQKAFYDSLKPFIESFTKTTLREFYEYWSEPNKSFTRIRCDTEKTWDLKRRLDRWANNERFGKKDEQSPKATIKWQNTL